MSDYIAMLAGKAPDDLSLLTFPLLGSYKLDGIRAGIVNGVVMTRKGKPVPNANIQRKFGKAVLNGLDGELIVGAAQGADVYNRCQSVIMSHEADAKSVSFHVFDMYNAAPRIGFVQRKQRMIQKLASFAQPAALLVKQVLIRNVDELAAFEKSALTLGYEGVMLRPVDGPYKQGRSTTREGYLLKLKRFEDSEATMSTVVPLVRANGKEDRKLAGSVIGFDKSKGWLVHVGSGFTDAERKEIMRAWMAGDYDDGPTFRYRYFPTGTHSAPRFPTWGGWRSDI